MGYFFIGTLLALSGGFINGLLAVNLPQIQDAWGLTNVCMSLLGMKARRQFGIQRFARLELAKFLVLNFSQLFVRSCGTELIVRGAAGIFARRRSNLGLFYFTWAMPVAKPRARVV